MQRLFWFRISNALNREKTVDYKPSSNYENYKNGIYDKASSQVPFGNYQDQVQNIGKNQDYDAGRLNTEDLRNIEEIKKKYACDQPKNQKVSDLYDDYKKKVPETTKVIYFHKSSRKRNSWVTRKIRNH